MPKKQSWIVRVRRTVIEDVVTTDCNEEEARNCPYGNFADSSEIYTEGYEVISVFQTEVIRELLQQMRTRSRRDIHSLPLSGKEGRDE